MTTTFVNDFQSIKLSWIANHDLNLFPLRLQLRFPPTASCPRICILGRLCQVVRLFRHVRAITEDLVLILFVAQLILVQVRVGSAHVYVMLLHGLGWLLGSRRLNRREQKLLAARFLQRAWLHF